MGKTTTSLLVLKSINVSTHVYYLITYVCGCFKQDWRFLSVLREYPALYLTSPPQKLSTFQHTVDKDIPEDVTRLSKSGYKVLCGLSLDNLQTCILLHGYHGNRFYVSINVLNANYVGKKCHVDLTHISMTKYNKSYILRL